MNIQFFEALKNLSKNKIARVLFILSLLSASGFVLFLESKTQLFEYLYPILDKIGHLILEKQSKYLFFIGALIISLLQLRDKKWILAKITIVIGCAWVIFHDSITSWLYALGVDSFTEAQNFDWREGVFYIQTMKNIIHPNFSYKQLILLILSIIIGIIIFSLLKLIRKRYGFSKEKFSYIKFFVGCLFITASLNLVFKTTIKKFNDSTNIFNLTAANFKNPSPIINFRNTGIKVVVYIGESTSVMNMGLYGYPRKTTPHLSDLFENDNNFLRFKNVFSTHTHTSQSLLEALSVNANNNNNEKILQPISARKRISLIDILNNGKIASYLYSNQGATGTWNLASSIIFKSAHKKFSTKSGIAGNADDQIKKPNDHEFFEQNLEPNIQSLPDNESAVIFLHSYSGHGNYLDNIPENFRQPIDTYISSQQPNTVVGSNIELIRDVEDYDSAIKYVDFSVSKTIEQIKKSEQPIVFLYFSDHGDAAFTGRGHDSARFIHEMARVPFIMYFNDKAREKYPALFEKYKVLSENHKVSTLAQVPSTIIDLLAGDIQNTSLKFLNINGIDIDESIPPIVVRETTSGGTYLNINEVASKNDKRNYVNTNDTATDIFVLSNSNKNKDTRICYDHSNTIGKALRGALVTDCLNLDITDLLTNNHSTDESTNNIISIVKENNLAIWVDLKNIDDPTQCTNLVNYLNETNLTNKNVLINFPSSTNLNNPELLSCSQAIKKLGFYISYNIPTDKLTSCVKSIKSKPDPTIDNSCKALENVLQNAVASNLFTDFSFDYDGILAIENISIANKLGWNMRNVDTKNFANIKPARFRMIILRNDDPNGI